MGGTGTMKPTSRIVLCDFIVYPRCATPRSMGYCLPTLATQRTVQGMVCLVGIKWRMHDATYRKLMHARSPRPCTVRPLKCPPRNVMHACLGSPDGFRVYADVAHSSHQIVWLAMRAVNL